MRAPGKRLSAPLSNIWLSDLFNQGVSCVLSVLRYKFQIPANQMQLNDIVIWMQVLICIAMDRMPGLDLCSLPSWYVLSSRARGGRARQNPSGGRCEGKGSR